MRRPHPRGHRIPAEISSALFIFVEWHMISLCSPLPRMPRPLRPLVSRPQVVNFFSLLFPTIVCVTTFVWIVFLVIAYHEESESYLKLHAMVSLAAKRYDAKKDVNFAAMYQASVKFIQINRSLTQRLRWNSFYWAAVGILTLLVSYLAPFGLICSSMATYAWLSMLTRACYLDISSSWSLAGPSLSCFVEVQPR